MVMQIECGRFNTSRFRKELVCGFLHGSSKKNWTDQ